MVEKPSGPNTNQDASNFASHPQNQNPQPSYQLVAYSSTLSNNASQQNNYNQQNSTFNDMHQQRAAAAAVHHQQQQQRSEMNTQVQNSNHPYPSSPELQKAHNDELNNKFDKIRQKIEEQPAELNAFKQQELPLARIKKIMKSDEDVRMISSEAPILFALACQMFITELTHKAAFHANFDNRKTLQRQDIHKVICENENFDFLLDVIPSGCIPDKFKMTPHQTALWNDCNRMKQMQKQMNQVPEGGGVGQQQQALGQQAPNNNMNMMMGGAQMQQNNMQNNIQKQQQQLGNPESLNNGSMMPKAGAMMGANGGQRGLNNNDNYKDEDDMQSDDDEDEEDDVS